MKNLHLKINASRIDTFIQFISALFILHPLQSSRNPNSTHTTKSRGKKTLFHQDATLSRTRLISPADGWLVKGGGREREDRKRRRPDRYSVHRTALVILQNWEWEGRGRSVVLREGREQRGTKPQQIKVWKTSNKANNLKMKRKEADGCKVFFKHMSYCIIKPIK